MPTDDLAGRLVAAGLLPSLVEQALAAADAAGQELPTEEDVARDSAVTETDLALAQVFWWYTPDVPQQFKRLLTARVRNTQVESVNATVDRLLEFNPYHEPAGSGKGGQFASAPGAGGWTPDNPVAQRFSGDNFREFTSAAQAHAVLGKQYADWADSLSKGEVAAIKTYQVGQYDRINDALRAGKQTDEVPFIDAALDKTSAPYNFITYRAVAGGAYKISDRFTEKAYTSTTVAAHIADRYRQQRGDEATIMRVHVRGGQKAGYLSAVHDTEDYEVLLPRNSHFIVKDVSTREFWGRVFRVVDVVLLDET